MAENKQLFHNIVVGGEKNKKSKIEKKQSCLSKKKKTIEDIHQ